MTRIALVTGAAGGIGRATVEVFAGAGWETIAADRKEGAGFPPGVAFRACDVSDPHQVAELFRWVAHHEARLDAVVNNAAILTVKPIVEMTVEEWDSVMASNLRSVFLTARYGFPLLRQAGGAIVNVSSVHALATSVDVSAYAASKGGIVALTRAMALEMAPVGIRVNAVLPGAVDTPMLRQGLQRPGNDGQTVEERLAALARKTALGRIGDPAEIARTILFLADSAQSSFMTGQSIVVDGGASCRLSTE